jgi:hypothetical protein
MNTDRERGGHGVFVLKPLLIRPPFQKKMKLWINSAPKSWP